MTTYEPAAQPSRAAWRDKYRWQIDRDRENRERREQARRDYQEAINAPCVHGSRVRAIGEQDGRPFAMLACPAGSPNCGVSYPDAATVYRQWRDGQPDTAGQGAKPA